MTHAREACVVDSPQHLHVRVRRRLQQSSYGEIRRLHCFWQQGKLVIEGVVCSYYLKQMVQRLIQGLEGEELIDNRVTVTGQQSHPWIEKTLVAGTLI